MSVFSLCLVLLFSFAGVIRKMKSLFLVASLVLTSVSCQITCEDNEFACFDGKKVTDLIIISKVPILLGKIQLFR